ncbi:hypothetical protein [uncultured Amnibacterium sp.]|uniref:hypothetical protein n=1 Tax=uncultured Amnibacterium sp. TaxID=1631851 RepID=UPI0035CBBCBB
MSSDRTVQLRRYQIVPGQLPDFTTWFTEQLVPARVAHGFTVEFAYALPESDEFVWAVSVAGDADEFRAVDERYTASPERAAAFDGIPKRVDSMAITLVQPVG